MLRPLWQTTPVDAEGVHRISISVVFGIPVSLQPRVELEVAHCTEFLLGRGGAEPESAQFRRVWSMDRTTCPSRRVVYIAALQQIVFNADRCAFECMFRDQCQTTKVSFSSQNFTSILDKYVPEWMGEDAINGLCFHPPRVQSYACFDLPMNRVGFPRSSRMMFAECESSKTLRQSQLSRQGSISIHSPTHPYGWMRHELSIHTAG